LTRSAAKRCSRRKLAMLKETNATGVRRRPAFAAKSFPECSVVLGWFRLRPGITGNTKHREPKRNPKLLGALPLDDPPTGSNVELDRRPCKKRAPDLALLAAAMLY
jgi:hypothetical protein